MRTLADLFQGTKEKYGNSPAFFARDEAGEFRKTTFSELYELGLQLGTALTELNFPAGARAVILGDNRLEWIIADYAVVLSGGVDVPRGSDVTDADLSHIIPHSGSEIVFVENDLVLKKLYNNKDILKKVHSIILMDPKSKGTGSEYHLWELVEKGKRSRDNGNRDMESRISQIAEEDLFTLIYTSGTTGKPKGVPLSHKNIMSQINRVPLRLSPGEKVLSILPIWHIFERQFEMLCISVGAATYYSSVRTLKEDMRNVKPTFMASAPRLWESIYQGIIAIVAKSSPVKRTLFRAAIFFSNTVHSAKRWLSFQELDMIGRSSLNSFFIGIFEFSKLVLSYVPHLVLDFIVLRKIRQATGGMLKGTISGGGALPIHVDKFFFNMGIPVYEGYGMTETSPTLAVRTFDNCVPGTVGPLYPGTDLRILDPNTQTVLFSTEKDGPKGYGKKGEIHVKGDQVMSGYYLDPENTRKVLQDSWMNTGDLGMITYNDCLKIVGRTKETIVLLGGENIEPVPIENMLTQSELILQCMVVGQDKKYLSVLIVPNPEFFPEYKAGAGFSSQEEESKCELRIQTEIRNSISATNGFKSFERVVDFRILPKPFEPGDELTAKLSVKRHVVSEKYSGLIEDIYADKKAEMVNQ
ncbi:long-chain fatty acid--CoA ligase [Leptospira langatensis]|uniref:Long-chain fatty acid--CoA ligase n=1 Tax=Leptospira langatensis TaxID=2484983 RepID=A0A5F1ZQ15_9LEPT|nr:long-chain fatty acid--CoA ligase [Leptospira langatensis]TGK05661.1 long-chain fatty acid--CoA ligase [Leptospira langatensis]TGL38797.1 long-chain fatty acid--CoA ligase [Leptospira langatensis]